MRTYYEFGTLRDALDYRRSNGTGGWIFAPDQRGGAILLVFPRDMLPSDVLRHPLTVGISGRLVGAD